MNHNLCCWYAKKDIDMYDLFDEESYVDWDRIPRIDMILDYLRFYPFLYKTFDNLSCQAILFGVAAIIIQNISSLYRA